MVVHDEKERGRVYQNTMSRDQGHCSSSHNAQFSQQNVISAEAEEPWTGPSSLCHRNVAIYTFKSNLLGLE